MQFLSYGCDFGECEIFRDEFQPLVALCAQLGQCAFADIPMHYGSVAAFPPNWQVIVWFLKCIPSFFSSLTKYHQSEQNFYCS